MRSIHWLLAVLPALAGCSDDFAPYSLLDRLRILAVSAEPATPMPGEATTLSALTFAPGGETPLLRWSWCPVPATAGDAYACPLDESAANQIFAAYLEPSAAPALPSFDLGAAATAAFVNPFSAGALATLCAAGVASPLWAQSFDCDDGYPVTVVLDAATTSASLRAGFVLRLPTSATPESNNNPAPAGLTLGGIPLGAAPATVQVAPGATIELRADVPPDAAELRSIPPTEGAPGQRLERLTVSWFATSGKIDKARTSFIDGVASLGDMASNRFTAPAAEAWPAGGLVEFAAVVRDDRGGVGWIEGNVVLGQAP
ncbi:MAG: hypothetical protein JXP73_14650 [Deltaproteobacteria bacterium]|nr:hypothetical protein [Deltaproteobacteria bacterium]